MQNPDAIGEVIESSTQQVVVEVYEETDAPSFGQWVSVPQDDDRVLHGLVSHVETGSVDANRQAVALGLSPDERAKEMPMVQELLRTTLRVQVLAWRDGERLRQTLPAHPPDIHDFVYPCSTEHVRAIGRPHDFLRTLVEHPDPAVPVDELLVAALQSVHEAHGGEHGGRQALVAAGRTLSRLLDDDHERLQSILRRVL